MIDFSRLAGHAAPTPQRWSFFAPPQFETLPAAHQDQLLFLDEASTRAAYDAAHAHQVICGDDWGNDPFRDGCYPSVERLALSDLPPDRLAGLKKWLYHRGVPFQKKVLLLPVFKAESDPAVVSTWKMVVKYADVFFSYDNLVITASSVDWCLYYHHDDLFHFASGRHTPAQEKTPHAGVPAQPSSDAVIETLRARAEALLQRSPDEAPAPADYDFLLDELQSAVATSPEAGRTLGPLIGQLAAARKAAQRGSNLYWHALREGALAVGHRPGKKMIQAMPHQGVTHVLTLLAASEGAEDIGRAVQMAGLAWVWLPLASADPPGEDRHEEITQTFEAVRQALDDGGHVYVHCSAGIHRTGMVTYALLQHLGLPDDEALAALAELRAETAEGVGAERLAWGRASFG